MATRTILFPSITRLFGHQLSVISNAEPLILGKNSTNIGKFRLLSQFSRSQYLRSGLSCSSCLSPPSAAGSPLQTPSLVSVCKRLVASPYTTSNPLRQEAQASEEPEDKLYKWIELKVKGHEDAVLDSYAKYVSLAANELDIPIESITKPFRTIRRLTLLKSRHIYKKHRVQYEMRTYYRVIKLKHLTGSTASVFLEYIQRNLPEGVAMQVKKCSLERLPNHLQSPPQQLSEDAELSSSSSSSSESEDER